MGILSWIIMGLIVGVLAKWIMPGRDPGGIIVTICIGMGNLLHTVTIRQGNDFKKLTLILSKAE